MSDTIRMEVPKAKQRNPLFMGGGRGSRGQTFKNRRDKRARLSGHAAETDGEPCGSLSRKGSCAGPARKTFESLSVSGLVAIPTGIIPDSTSIKTLNCPKFLP
jgi:hypothetical protein